MIKAGLVILVIVGSAVAPGDRKTPPLGGGVPSAPITVPALPSVPGSPSTGDTVDTSPETKVVCVAGCGQGNEFCTARCSETQVICVAGCSDRIVSGANGADGPNGTDDQRGADGLGTSGGDAGIGGKGGVGGINVSR